MGAKVMPTHFSRRGEIDTRWFSQAKNGWLFYLVWKLSGEAWTLDTELGLTYLNELFAENAGVQDRNEYVAAHVGYEAGWGDADERMKFSHRGDLYPAIDGSDAGGTPGFYRFDTTLRMNVTESFFTQFQWLFTRTSVPQDGKGKNDNLFLVTVGWGF